MCIDFCALSRTMTQKRVSLRLQDYGFISVRKVFETFFMLFVCIIVGWDLGFAGKLLYLDLFGDMRFVSFAFAMVFAVLGCFKLAVVCTC